MEWSLPIEACAEPVDGDQQGEPGASRRETHCSARRISAIPDPSAGPNPIRDPCWRSRIPGGWWPGDEFPNS